MAQQWLVCYIYGYMGYIRDICGNIDTMVLEQNCHICHFLHEMYENLIQISLEFVPKSPVHNVSPLVASGDSWVGNRREAIT